MNERDREDFVLMKVNIETQGKDIEKQGKNIEDIKENQEVSKEKLDKLLFHLVGDKDTNTKGWIQKLTRFDYRLTMMERAVIIFVGLASSTAMYLIFVKNIFEIIQ